jgi:hypothetical protein
MSVINPKFLYKVNPGKWKVLPFQTLGDIGEMGNFPIKIETIQPFFYKNHSSEFFVKNDNLAGADPGCDKIPLCLYCIKSLLDFQSTSKSMIGCSFKTL